MNTLKIELKHNMAEALEQLFGEYTANNYTEPDDMLVIAVLAEIQIQLKKRLAQPQQKYRFTLKPATAIALQIFYDDFIGEYTTQTGNRLHQISNQVKQLYQ